MSTDTTLIVNPPAQNNKKFQRKEAKISMPTETLPAINNGTPAHTVQELVTEAARKNITCEFCIQPSAFNEDPITIRIIGCQNDTTLDYIPEHIAKAHIISTQCIGKNKPLYMLTIGTDIYQLVSTWDNRPEITLHPSLKDAWTAMCEALGKSYEFHFNFNGRGKSWSEFFEQAKAIMKLDCIFFAT